MMVRACLDESGQEASDFCVCAGFLTDSTTWRALNSEWAAILARKSVKEFKAERFFGRREPYDNWNGEEAADFLEALLGTMRNRDLWEVEAVVKVPDFNSLNKSERLYLTGASMPSVVGREKISGAQSKPYFLSMQVGLERAIRAGQGSRVHIVHDDTKEYRPLATKIFERLQAKPRNAGRLAGPTFRASETSGGLQLADMFAYLLRRGFTSDFSGIKWTDQHQRALVQLRWGKFEVPKPMDSDWFKRAFATLEPEDRDLLRQDRLFPRSGPPASRKPSREEG